MAIVDLRDRSAKHTAVGPGPHHASGRAASTGDEGFSLIELVVVSLILPIVIGAITLALVSLFTLQNSVASGTSASADAQTSSAFYEQDVHDAAYLTTSSQVGQCGGGTQLLGTRVELQLEHPIVPDRRDLCEGPGGI